MLNFDPARFLRIQTGTVTIARDLGAVVGRLVAEGTLDGLRAQVGAGDASLEDTFLALVAQDGEAP